MKPKEHQTSESELTRKEYAYALYDDLLCTTTRIAERIRYINKDIERLNKLAWELSEVLHSEDEFAEALKEIPFSEAEK